MVTAIVAGWRGTSPVTAVLVHHYDAGVSSMGTEPAGWDAIRNRAGLPVSGTLKVATLEEIVALSAKARQRHWSGQGRPGWLSEHSADLQRLYVEVLIPDREYVRCSIVAILGDGTGGHFAVDISREDLDGLPDVSPQELNDLAHRYLLTFKSIPLDRAQQAAWDKLYEERRRR